MNNAILAKVGTLTVTEAEVEEMILSLRERGQNYDTPDARAMILEQLINNKLLLLDAQKNLYEYDPMFKAQLKKVKEDMLTQFALAKALDSVKAPTEAEVKEYYEQNRDKLEAGEAVNASHILVSTEEEANRILDEIKSGSISFEDAARKYSSCPSKENGGNLGEFTHGQMVKEFDDAAFAMNEGEISAPVKTQFGYHLIKLNSKIASKTYAFDEVRGELMQMLMKEKQQKAYQSKIGQLKILYPVDKM